MAAPPTSIQTSGQEPDLPADGADAVELAERSERDAKIQTQLLGLEGAAAEALSQRLARGMAG